MKTSKAENAWSRGILVRSLIFGMVLGGVAFASSSVALALAADEAGAVPAVVATLLVAFGVGIWAGVAPADQSAGRMSQHWLATAGFVAAAGSFSTFLEFYERVLPGPWWLFAGLIVGLAVPAYMLGMIPPALLAWSRGTSDEMSVAADALGTMTLGIMAGATLGVLVVGLVALPTFSQGTVLIACALILLVPMVLPGPVAAHPIERVLYDAVSPFGHLLVTEVEYRGERQPERRLYLNGEEESGELVRSGAPTLAYIAAAESWLSGSTPAGGRYLFLGGGAYTLPRRIAERDPRAQIVVVELDPDVTRIAQRFFGLKSTLDIRTVNGDARAFLDRADDASFDRIYVDVYGGGETLPHALVTQEAVEATKRRLSPDGIAAVNLIGAVVGEDQRPLWSVITTFANVFVNVAVYLHLGRDYPERQNLLLLGRMESAPSFPTSAGGFDLWPRDEWPTVEGAIIYHDIAPHSSASSDAGIFPPPAQRRQRLG